MVDQVSRCKTIHDLALKDEKASVVGLKQDGKLHCNPAGDMEIKAGGQLILIGELDILRQFGDKL